MRRLAPFLLLLACLTAGCGTVTGQDRPGTDATLLLDSTPNAVHAGTYLATLNQPAAAGAGGISTAPIGTSARWARVEAPST